MKKGTMKRSIFQVLLILLKKDIVVFSTFAFPNQTGCVIDPKNKISEPVLPWHWEPNRPFPIE